MVTLDEAKVDAGRPHETVHHQIQQRADGGGRVQNSGCKTIKQVQSGREDDELNHRRGRQISMRGGR